MVKLGYGIINDSFGFASVCSLIRIFYFRHVGRLNEYDQVKHIDHRQEKIETPSLLNSSQ